MRRSIIPLKQSIAYGPVDSRRLGRSLGVNILPSRGKVCPFDCVYCQYGHTKLHAASPEGVEDLPGAAHVEKALVDALASLREPPHYITLSGNGEPTLHPDLGRIVSVMNAVRDRMAPEARTAALSNSATVGRPEVREALSRLDVRIMKLDAGNADVFRRFNAVCPGVAFETVVEGLSVVGGVTIQTLLAAGPEGNFTADNIEDWIACLHRIRPVAVQVYSLDRGTLSRLIHQVPLRDLEALASRLRDLGFAATAYGRP